MYLFSNKMLTGVFYVYSLRAHSLNEAMNTRHDSSYLTAMTGFPCGSRMWPAAVEKLGSEIDGGERLKNQIDSFDPQSRQGRGSP